MSVERTQGRGLARLGSERADGSRTKNDCRTCVAQVCRRCADAQDGAEAAVVPVRMVVVIGIPAGPVVGTGRDEGRSRGGVGVRPLAMNLLQRLVQSWADQRGRVQKREKGGEKSGAASHGFGDGQTLSVGADGYKAGSRTD